LCTLFFLYSKKTQNRVRYTCKKPSIFGDLFQRLNIFHDPGNILSDVQEDRVVIVTMIFTFRLHGPERRDAPQEPASVNSDCETTSAVASASCGPIFITGAEIFTRNQIATEGRAVSSLEALFVRQHWQVGLLELGRKDDGLIVQVASGTKSYNLKAKL
jgi:hypothetical protein